ncbi:triose-phosphate transporter family-domain-containing protein [Cokeromyces recurvatus]|uniref:triose-phosphate transporter family-domain-containing protein n=1 Tax=Cokeromyces recurvatus TaxID=90255 RepID=UPI002220E74B|nr:triose-phosphate transporter family-domain-containing protein [Cokeromyces recurvatus]KAI7908205.1 triose-phosphate transporter family-domain-containing protein [Cokeromyces recurvatus]
MIKSSTPIWTLLFSFLFGFEKPRLRLVAIITCIIFGVLLTIDGEPHINLQGFTLVLVAAISSGLRWNLTQFLLKDSNISNHGPLVIMYHLSPVMFITMLSLSLYIEQPFFYHHDFTTDSIHTIKEIVISISIMSVGGILAFLMTLSELYLIKGTNTVTLSVAGVGKEIFIIGLSVIIYGDVLTLKTYLGLFISIMGIIGYNYYKHQSKDSHKACPDKQKRYLE